MRPSSIGIVLRLGISDEATTIEDLGLENPQNGKHTTGRSFLSSCLPHWAAYGIGRCHMTLAPAHTS